jgi:hypothetical protein
VGHIREQRATRLLEDVLLDWLEEGTIPTTGELQEAYNQAEIVHGDFTRSKLRQVSLPDRYSESSAIQHNAVLDALDGDIDVLLRALVKITDLGIDFLGDWNSRAKSLNVRIAKLKSRIESLLLLKSDSAGYVSFVEDNFLSLEDISSDTTANVDTRTGEVSLNIDTSEGKGNFQGTQIDLDSAEISWSLIESNNVRFQANPGGSNLENIISDKYNRWGSEVNAIRPDKFRTASASGKPIMGELKVKLAEDTEVSKIVLLTHDATSNNSSVVGCQYSTDGYTWENVPSESPVQSGFGNFIWRFEKTLIRWFKIIISKSSPDLSSTKTSIYDIGFERIKIYSEVFERPSTDVEIVTETRTPILGGSDVTFGRASLEVCEEIPQGTSIRYFLRAYDGSSYTSWVQVSPLSREVEDTPAVVDFAAPTKLSSEDIQTTFDSSLDTEALNLLRVDGSSNITYRFNGPDDTIANFYIAQNDNLLTDLVLIRNRGYSAAKFPSVSADLLVGDIECGWGLDGDSVYYCEFLVNRSEGREIDLGPTQAIIDGSSVSGVVTLNPGWHTFRTDRANWSSLIGTVPTNTIGLEALDPLYPYNHKYLIEGYNYPSTWSGKKVYLGFDEYGQYRATRIGRHLFTNTQNDYSVYALDSITGPKTILLLKVDSSRPNHTNERIRLFYTRRYNSFEGIQMKAVFKTENVEKSPILSYYRVRVK